jgi:hypothetical protein
MKFTQTVLGVLLAFGFAAHAAHAAGMIDELNADQKAKLLRGEQVWWTTDVRSMPWPRITLYQLVKATPDETMAVGLDFESKPPYTPGLKSSKILRWTDAASPVVQYVMDIPMFSDETVVHQFHISLYGEKKDSYRLEWKLLKGGRTKQSDGVMRAEPYGSETIVGFTGFVHPDMPFAGAFKGVARNQTLEQTTGFIKQVEKEHLEQGEVLRREMEVLKKAVGQ